jgi:hypothetical protein
MAQPSYPQALPLQAVAQRLSQALTHPKHTLIADDYSLLDSGQLIWKSLLGHRQITGSYLLGLAVRHRCRLVAELEKNGHLHQLQILHHRGQHH